MERAPQAVSQQVNEAFAPALAAMAPPEVDLVRLERDRAVALLRGVLNLETLGAEGPFKTNVRQFLDQLEVGYTTVGTLEAIKHEIRVRPISRDYLADILGEAIGRFCRIDDANLEEAQQDLSEAFEKVREALG